MKTFKISEGSWHHRLATVYGDFDAWNTWNDQDFCSYVQQVFLGVLVCIGLVVGISLFLALVQYGIIACIVNWQLYHTLKHLFASIWLPALTVTGIFLFLFLRFGLYFLEKGKELYENAENEYDETKKITFPYLIVFIPALLVLVLFLAIVGIPIIIFVYLGKLIRCLMSDTLAERFRNFSYKIVDTVGRKTESSVEFLKLAYQSIKEKTCFKIEITDTK
jgi:hypothetical protein